MRPWCALLLVLVLAVFLASCSDDTCQTCPQDNTARITVVIRPLVLRDGIQDTLRLDSARVSVDGSALRKCLPGNTVVYEGLSEGRHSIYVERWYKHFGAIESEALTVAIDLNQGERRSLDIHNDFPLITWLPPRLDRALARWWPHPASGWASA